MREVSHTHPYTQRGAVNRPFERGPVVVADGGEREAYDANEDEDDEEVTEAREEDDLEAEEEETKTAAEEGKTAEEDAKAREKRKQMKDVDHTPPHGDGVDRVFKRGGEDEPVQAEE